MTEAKCYQCGKYYDANNDGWYSLHLHVGVHKWLLCSLACLVTFAREQRDGTGTIRETWHLW